MKIKFEYLVGKTTLSEWAGVYGYKPDNSDEIEFFSIMRIKADSEEVSLEMIAKMLFDEIQNAFFDETNPERDLVLRLETSAWKMKSKMDLILSRELEISRKGLDIELAVAVIYQDYLYLGVIGESKIYVNRGDEVVELSKALVDGDMSGFLKSGSLELEEGDRIFLLTSRLADQYKNEISEVLKKLDISLLNNSLEESGAAGILVADENEKWKSIPMVEEMPKEEFSKDDILKKPEPHGDDVEMGDEEYYEEGSVPLKDRISNAFLLARSNVSKITDKVRNLRGTDKSVEPELENSEQRYSSMMSEEQEALRQAQDDIDEEFIGEPQLKDKIIQRASKFSATAKEKWQTSIKPRVQSNQKTYMIFLRKLGWKVSALIKQAVNFLKKELIGTGDRRDMYKRGKERSRNRKIALIVVIIVAVFLYIGLRNAEATRREQEKIETARKSLNALEDRYENLANQLVQTKTENDEKKTLLINEFNNLTNDIDNQKKSGLFIDELNSLTSQIQTSTDDLLFIEAFTQPKLVTDVGKSHPDSNLSDIVYSNGAVYISDMARNVVYKVSTATLDNTPEAFVTDLTEPYLLVTDAAGDIVFYDNNSTSSLGKFGYNDPNITRFGQLSPASIGKPTESVIFEGNNALYELKAINKQIFKRDKSGDTYVNGGAAISTDPNTNWRTDNDYINGIDIAAPYEVYVLISGQGVKRYFARNENTLTFETYNNFLRKDFDSLSNATAFDVTGRYMAVGDPVNQRVLLFQVEDNEEKNITFIKQFVYRGGENVFNDIEELVINEQDRSIYVLDALKVIKLQF